MNADENTDRTPSRSASRSVGAWPWTPRAPAASAGSASSASSASSPCEEVCLGSVEIARGVNRLAAAIRALQDSNQRAAAVDPTGALPSEIVRHTVAMSVAIGELAKVLARLEGALFEAVLHADTVSQEQMQAAILAAGKRRE